jgi:flap endonuclease-1
MPEEIRGGLGDAQTIDEVRRIFLQPEVTDEFEIRAGEPDLGGVVRFLCDQREFSRERVQAALERAFQERTLW